MKKALVLALMYSVIVSPLGAADRVADIDDLIKSLRKSEQEIQDQGFVAFTKDKEGNTQDLSPQRIFSGGQTFFLNCKNTIFASYGRNGIGLRFWFSIYTAYSA